MSSNPAALKESHRHNGQPPMRDFFDFLILTHMNEGAATPRGSVEGGAAIAEPAHLLLVISSSGSVPSPEARLSLTPPEYYLLWWCL
jgi:hypothetical protein